MGDKKTYDPRAYLKKAENSMKARVFQAIDDLKGTGKTLFK
jgi:fructose-bisphosphate aldolase, class II